MVADRAAVAFRPPQAGPRQNGEVRRHGVVGNVEAAGDVAGGNAAGMAADELAEDGEARRLRQRRERPDRCFLVHLSGIIDIP